MSAFDGRPSLDCGGSRVRVLTAAACFFCRQDRPLTKGVCESCAPAPTTTPRWKLQIGDDVWFVVTDETKARILRMHPEATVTDLQRRDCDPCGGSCEGRCDAGAGSWPERLAAEAQR